MKGRCNYQTFVKKLQLCSVLKKGSKSLLKVKESAVSKSTLTTVWHFGAQFAARKRRKQAEKNLTPFSKLIYEHRLSAIPVFHPKTLNFVLFPFLRKWQNCGSFFKSDITYRPKIPWTSQMIYNWKHHTYSTNNTCKNWRQFFG